MPCTAKKTEILRDHQNAAGVPDVDIVLTTREFARLVKSRGIDFRGLPDESFDSPIGEGSTAGLIFGATGGVMEAALRTVADVVYGEDLEKVDYKAVRGMKGIKSASLDLKGTKVNIAVASSLSNAKALLEEIKAGKSPYHFIEVMCCPGGCVNGGGQPIQPSSVRNAVDVPALRAKALYDTDKKSRLRKSHENPVVKTLYKDYFGAPNSHKAHETLHTSYVRREKY